MFLTKCLTAYQANQKVKRRNKVLLKEKKKSIIEKIKSSIYQGHSGCYLLLEPEDEIKTWLRELGYKIYLNERSHYWTISWEK